MNGQEDHTEDVQNEEIGEKEKKEEEPQEKERDYIYLVDNYPFGFPTDRISRFESIISRSIAELDIKTVHYTRFSKEEAQKSIGVILSGSSNNVSDLYFADHLKKRYDPQLEFIRDDEDIPILGVCFGHHLVAYAFGADVNRMRIPGLGGRIVFILLKETDDIITRKNIPVNAHHRDFLSPNDIKIREKFDILSVSTNKRYRIIQYLHHKTKPIYAVQFHPETHMGTYFHASHFEERIVTKTKTEGEQIIENFLWQCKYLKENKNKL
ncbi:MAG: glutamine amidotransferase-related protein [Promethearchaeia archaeon]